MLFVAEAGAVAFEIPSGWVIRHDGKQTISLHDVPPPADSCRIAITIFHLPPVRGGWSALPLREIFEQVQQTDGSGSRTRRNKTATDKKTPALHTEQRVDLELVWADKGCWPDPENGKPIRCRQILARARLVQVLITFDTYEDRKAQFEAAWNDLFTTLKVAIPRDLIGQVVN